MVRELIERTGLSWQIIATLAASMLTIIVFSIQLGSYRAIVEVNTHRLDVVEHHDVETRDIESRLSERIGRLETLQDKSR